MFFSLRLLAYRLLKLFQWPTSRVVPRRCAGAGASSAATEAFSVSPTTIEI